MVRADGLHGVDSGNGSVGTHSGVAVSRLGRVALAGDRVDADDAGGASFSAGVSLLPERGTLIKVWHILGRLRLTDA